MDMLQRKLSDFELRENIRKLQNCNNQGKKSHLSPQQHQPKPAKNSSHRLRPQSSHLAEEIHEFVEKKKSEIITLPSESSEERERRSEVKIQELKDRLESKKEEVLVLREKLRSLDYHMQTKNRKIEK